MCGAEHGPRGAPACPAGVGERQVGRWFGRDGVRDGGRDGRGLAYGSTPPGSARCGLIHGGAPVHLGRAVCPYAGRGGGGDGMNDAIALKLAGLTERQSRVLRRLASGTTEADLAVRLGLSPRAARHEARNLLDALGLRSCDEAAVLWWGNRAGARADLLAAARALVA
jgi:DNA-binding CsgD family transcriptional regulator